PAPPYIYPLSYTTLFRSLFTPAEEGRSRFGHWESALALGLAYAIGFWAVEGIPTFSPLSSLTVIAVTMVLLALVAVGEHLLQPRSEEHTSELQSRENLVC